MYYSHQEWQNGTKVTDVSDWIDLTRFDPETNLTYADTPLLVNIKGCGYPPDINCKAFANKYENLSDEGDTFPCHYSR